MSRGIPGVRQYTTTEALGVSGRRYYEEYGAPSDSTCEGVPLPRGDLVGDWLRAHDPRLTVEGIADEMEAALASEGLTVAVSRGAFGTWGGRPTTALLELRTRVCRALLPLWDDDRRRDHMAQVLDCDRKTLRRLMGKLPHDTDR
jgi:hypothetical protein